MACEHSKEDFRDLLLSWFRLEFRDAGIKQSTELEGHGGEGLGLDEEARRGLSGPVRGACRVKIGCALPSNTPRPGDFQDAETVGDVVKLCWDALHPEAADDN